MKKINIKFYNKNIYYEKLDNGLEVYMFPNNKIKDIYVSLTTRYGGCNYLFMENGRYKRVPNGIAHFLEHKLFEQENGLSPMLFYSKTGSYCNAETDYKKTSYIFSCNNNFKKNLDYLLNYVKCPYFTEENVFKEKGIIEQEIKMYDDMPTSVVYEGILANILKKHPMKHSIAGKIKDIYKITKEDLYSCYNTFYVPSNMFIVITGNINPNKTLEIIKNNNMKISNNKIELMGIEEPPEVRKKKEIHYYNLEIPKVSYGVKIPTGKFKNIDLIKLSYYVHLIVDILFDKTSIFFHESIERKLLKRSLKLDIEYIDNYFILIISFDSKKYNEVIKNIKSKLNNITINEEDLERKKKAYIGNIYYSFDNIDVVENIITESIIKYSKIHENIYDIINELNIEEINSIARYLDFSNDSIYIMKSKKS